MTDNRMERRLAAILAADVAGYSRLMGADEEGVLERLKAIRKSLVDPAITAHRGRIVKTTGDGLLVEFASAVDAARCATEVQRGMAERNVAVPQVMRIEFRIGIHLGDIIIDENDIFGDGVNIAARLEGIAEPGGVCISDDAQRQIRGKVDVAFDDMGEKTLKNITEPMRAWRLMTDAKSSALPSPKRSIDTAQPLALPDKPSIAVLPFEIMSGDPEQEYLADGLAEDITTALSKVRSFFVIARNSSFTFKGKAVEVKQVGRDLGVRYVLEGSVRKAGNRVRITAQFVDAVTSHHIWADRYDRELADIFAVQDEITERVVAAIEPHLYATEGSKAKRKPPESLDAWECVVRGLSLMNTRVRTDATAARELLQQAIALDPNYAQAYGLLSYITTLGVHLGWDPLKPTLTFASTAAHKAVLLDDEEPWAHLALGYTLIWSKQAGAAVAELEKALALNPNFAIAHYALALAFCYLGRGKDALILGDKAALLSPRDLLARGNAGVTNNVRCFACFVSGRYRDGIEFGQRAIADNPSSSAGFRPLVANWALAGEIEEARATLQKLKLLQPDISIQWINETVPFANPDALQRYVEGFRLAGLE